MFDLCSILERNNFKYIFLATYTFLMSILFSWEVSFNVSFFFWHNDVNQLQCSVVLIWLKIAYFQKYFKKNFIAPFYGWRSTTSSLEPLWGGSFLFTTNFSEIPGTHFINLGSFKGWKVELTFDPMYKSKKNWF